MEKEVMAECGSWRSLYELEEYLTLDELFELYEMAGERQFRMMASMARAMGAEVEDPYADREEYDSLVTQADMAPFQIGYSTE